MVPDALATRWNSRNRVVPDVATVGDPNTGFLTGQTQAFPNGPRYAEYRVGGTSLSCPVFAAIMALADQSAGMRHGFANPALYAHAGSQAFRDIADPASPMASIRVLFNNSLNPRLGLDFALRSYNQTGTLDVVAGYDDVTGSWLAERAGVPGRDVVGRSSERHGRAAVRGHPPNRSPPPSEPVRYGPTGRSAAWLARVLWEHEVAGSSPAAPTRICLLPETFNSRER